MMEVVQRSRFRVAPYQYYAQTGSGHTPSRGNDEYWIDCDVPWVTTADVKHLRDGHTQVLKGTEHQISRLGLANSAARLHPAGTVVLSRTASVGFSAIMDVPMATSQDFVTWSPGAELDSRFFLWVLRAMKGSGDLDSLMYGSTHKTIYVPDLQQLRGPLPPLDVQRRIADYLDTETAHIDTLIQKQGQLIDLLRERWAGSVATAVDAATPRTYGARLKHVVRLVRQGWSPQCHSTPADGVEAWAVLKAGASNGGVFRPDENKALPDDAIPRPDLVVEAGDLLISRANTRELVGSAAVVSGHFPRLMLSDKLYALRLEESVASPEYVAMVLGTRRWRGLIELNASGSSSSMQNITREDILNLPMDLPTLEKQEQILLSLRYEAASIHRLMARATRGTELLRERRQALITAAVTGEFEI